MKIYLLMMLIGTLLTAIHFTSAPNSARKRFHNSGSLIGLLELKP